MINITFIVPYPSMKSAVEKIFREHSEREVIQHSIVAKAVDEIHKGDLSNTDIVIARGYSANRAKLADVPVLDITVTGFDITVALNSCIEKFNPRKIAVVGPLNTVYGIEEIKNVFSCEITSYQVDNPENLENVIKQAEKDGVDAIIAGKTGTTICRNLGINNVMILSGRKTILQAVDEAIRTVRLMWHERERTDPV